MFYLIHCWWNRLLICVSFTYLEYFMYSDVLWYRTECNSEHMQNALRQHAQTLKMLAIEWNAIKLYKHPKFQFRGDRPLWGRDLKRGQIDPPPPPPSKNLLSKSPVKIGLKHVCAVKTWLWFFGGGGGGEEEGRSGGLMAGSALGGQIYVAFPPPAQIGYLHYLWAASGE